MPHMRYFQSLADIRNHYDRILEEMDRSSKNAFSETILVSWGIKLEDRPQIEEEKKVLDYLIACQTSIAHGENAHKPSQEVVNRCFNRHIDFLEHLHKVDPWRVNQHRSKNIVKQYKACRHYIFKFSLQGWVDSMPNTVLTFKNKYPHHV